jgi:hypothetical protein
MVAVVAVGAAEVRQKQPMHHVPNA